MRVSFTKVTENERSVLQVLLLIILILKKMLYTKKPCFKDPFLYKYDL